MRTYVYLSADGVKYAVYHRNESNLSWQHPYAARKKCGACTGSSTAAPK